MTTTDLERRLRALRDQLPEPPRALDPATLTSAAEVTDLAEPVPLPRRRARWVVAALVAAALVVGVVVAVQVVRGSGVDRRDATGASIPTLTTLGPTDTAAQVVHDGDRVQGDGSYYVPSDGTVWFCAPAPVAVASGADSCLYHVVVQGLDAATLPPAADGVPAWVHVVGTYRDGVVTDAVATPASRPDPPLLDVPPPCAAPPGGWPTRPDDSNNVNMAPLDAYQAAHPDEVVGIATLYASANQPVAYLLTSGDAAAAEAALRPTNGVALCVAHSDVTPAQSAAARAAFPPSEPGGDGVFTTSGTNPGLGAAAEVSVVLVTPALAARAAAFPSGLVRFDPLLTPVR